MTFPMVMAATFLGYSAALLGTAIYSALSHPSTNYAKLVRETITSDMESVLRDAKFESETIPKKDEYPTFAEVFHNGIIDGYEGLDNSVAGQSAFLDSVYAIARYRGSTLHVYDIFDARGRINPRQVPLEEIIKLAKTTFETWAERDYNSLYISPWGD